MRKSIACMLFTLAAAAGSPALACSVEPAGRAFHPNREAFDRKHDFPIALEVPAPVVTVISVKRGTSDIPGNCGTYAVVELALSLPDESDFSLSELGFVFRSEPGKPQDPFVSFPNVPITPRVTDGKVAHFTFRLIDTPATRSQPLELTIDVFAINHGLQVSQSTAVLVAHR